MNATEFKGYFGEFFAAILLRMKGYKILERRYKVHCGEIDIIAKKKNKIAFVEVKSRTDEEKCFVAITSKQLSRIQNASRLFLQSHPNFQNCVCSYDVILIADWKLPIHIENVSL